LNIFDIWKDKYANAYYTAAVTSMLQSFHNFFYASFDPGGYVTVDKPPVVFWIQTMFAAVFGVHGWSVILPQALAGVGSVLMMYILVKPSFGKTAARLASLVMACTPVAAAISRSNNIDSMLVFALLLATWMLFKGMRRQKISWILGAFAMIGVGFNMKMLEAYMVVPAIYLFYLLAFKSGWKKKLTVLAAATVLMAAVSLSWAVVVDSIPADQRPYIGSSQTNSVLELAFGYNGMSRLTGMHGGGKGASGKSWMNGEHLRQAQGNGRNMAGDQHTAPNGKRMPGPFGMSNGKPGQMPRFDRAQGPGSGGMFGTGQPGPLRLFQSELSGQISWLLPFVAFASAGLLAGVRRKKPLTDQQQETLFWLGWLLPVMAFFSVAGFFHQYYLVMLAPPIAALTGTGWVALWRQYRNKEEWKRWLLPSGILATTAFELVVLHPYQQQIGVGWSIGIGVAGIGLSLVLFVAAREKWIPVVALAGMLVLLVAPLYWAATPIIYGENSMIPEAGPVQRGFGPGMAMGKRFANPQMSATRESHPFSSGRTRGGRETQINSKLLQYVTSHNTGEKYLFATTNAMSAAPYIIETGKPVMAMGGFSGSDPILTVSKLEEMVKTKEVKFFLIPSQDGFRGFGDGNESNRVFEWIRAHGKEVPKSEWQPDSSPDHGFPMHFGGGETLYEIEQ
jgi:4-amino-4-deoxy-L-arabinose transferase-like glycosyltransferase